MKMLELVVNNVKLQQLSASTVIACDDQKPEHKLYQESEQEAPQSYRSRSQIAR